MTSTATYFEQGRYVVVLDRSYVGSVSGRIPSRGPVQHLINPRWETCPDSGCDLLVGIAPGTGARWSVYGDLVRSVERLTKIIDRRATGDRTGWVLR